MKRHMAVATWKRVLWDDGWAVLVLRLLVGFGFAAHGYAKLERGPAQFAAALTAMHVVAPLVMAWCVTLVELVGGILLMAGLFVRPLCLPLALIMLTALVTVHLPYGFSSIRLRAVTAAGAQFGPVGYEINLLYLAALLVLSVSPTGAVSVRAWLDARRKGSHVSV
jgi:putative oxidoreductase